MIKKIILFAFVSIIFSYSNAAYGSAVYSGEKDTVDCITCITPEELEFRNQNPLVDRIGLEMTWQEIDIPLSYSFTIYPNGDYSEKNYVNCMTCIVQDDHKTQNTQKIKSEITALQTIFKTPEIKINNLISDVKLPIEINIEKDKITSHGYSRDHYMFSQIMDSEERIAKQVFNSDDFKNYLD